FDDVVGQEHITQTLKNAIAANRLAHAYLFVGPRGTGKTSTARILAKALNCVHGPTVTPCGECDPCKEIAAGNSLDVLEIDGASNNGVEQVRELRENVRFAPTRGKYKVYIIDEVHMLTTAAFNALLKTLEEPPEHVKFVFATTDVQKVLPTILSRCQRFDLRRIPAELIANHLQFIAAHERITLAPDAARAIAKGAEGGLRDAESMLDQLVAFCGEVITETDVLSVFGFTAAHTVSELCESILYANSPAALGIVQQQAEAGRDLSRLMSDLIGHLRNLLVAKADPEGIKSEVGADVLETLQAQADRIALDRLLDLIEQFAAAEGRMKWAPNKKLHFEIAVIKAIQTLGQATLTEVLDTLTILKTGGELPAPKPAAPRPAPRPAPKPEPEERPIARRSLVEAFHKEIVSAPAPAPAPIPKPVAAAPIPSPAPRVEESSEPTLAPWDDRPAPAAIPDENTLSLFSEEQLPTVQEPAFQVPVVEPEPEVQPTEPELTEPSAVAPNLWVNLLLEIRDQKPLLRSWVEAGALLGIANGVCTIGFPQEAAFSMESLGKPIPRKFLEETLARLLGQPITLKLELSPGLIVPPVDLPQKAPQIPTDPMEAFKNDPLIRHALELFKAEIQVG
ncbi:MAG: DNA polymerase III subunit gamma/tau, partial [Verrucomicrobia bacterium]|nr:DNA polymerase III subunit gamma/tau [Verrucomicrobiota bacterium]